ncbi:Host cell factor, partial [Gryllus bimaculatus]
MATGSLPLQRESRYPASVVSAAADCPNFHAPSSDSSARGQTEEMRERSCSASFTITMFWTIHMEGSPCTLNTPAVAVGNSIFSFGQACCDRSSQNLVVRMFNTTNYRWSFMETRAEEGERIPDERYGHTAVAYMSKVYVWGGSTQDENYFFRKLCCFDTTTNTWSFPEVSGSIPRGRVNHFACLVGNLMYIIGGFEQFRPNICKEIYALDLESMTWDIVKTREKFPKLNMKCCFAVMGNRIYFFTGKLHWNEITYLDTVTCKWSTTFATGQVLSLRRWAQTFVFGRHIYLFGGRDEIYYLDYNDIQRYTPETNEWKAVKPLGLAPVP